MRSKTRPTHDYDVERVSVEEMLAERKALLARLEAEQPFPGLDRFKREVQCGIDRLTRRIEGTEATKSRKR